jgi:hypothetical protein
MSEEQAAFFGTLARFKHLGESGARRLAYETSLAVREAKRERRQAQEEDRRGRPKMPPPTVRL